MAKIDLRQEVMARLNDPETRRRIADALITEATGGPPDPKSGLPKGGATVIRAFELIREIALERAPDPVAESDFSRYADAELVATLARLEAEESQSDGGPSGTPHDGTPSENGRLSERERAPPGRASAGGRDG